MNCAKGLDRSFLHYGIREEDLKVIRELCVKHGIPQEWLVASRAHHALAAQPRVRADRD